MSYVNPSHDAIQVILAFPELVEAFESWVASRGAELFQIPIDDTDELPTYAIRPIGGKPSAR